MKLFCFFLAAFALLNAFDIHNLNEKRSLLEGNSIGPAINFTSRPFVALIVSGGINNTILNACTGTILNTKSKNFDNHNTSWILTSTFCILNRQDPGNTSKDILYKVLIEDPSGSVQLAGKKFTLFDPILRVLNPQAGTIKNYTAEVSFPPGPKTQFINVSINVFDVGLIRLDRLIDIPGVVGVDFELSPIEKLAPGSKVSLLGYGAPNFLSLHETSRLETIRARNSTGQQPDDLLFFHDSISLLPSTTASTNQEGVEVADEGGPILNSDGRQIAIGQATWRVKPDNNTILTFAAFGPSIAFHQQYISDVLSVFVPPGTPASGLNHSDFDNSSNIQSYGTKLYASTALLFSIITFLFC